jgi:hypothetical protein
MYALKPNLFGVALELQRLCFGLAVSHMISLAGLKSYIRGA